MTLMRRLNRTLNRALLGIIVAAGILMAVLAR
jgi:hypothetical protein